MHFPDFEKYTYYSEKPFPNVETIGWIDRNHDFQVGISSPIFLNNLYQIMAGNEYVNVHVNRLRGVHECNLCGVSNFTETALSIGSTEIWIPNGKGGFYASPSMIFHYIKYHDYKPPEVYMNAVIRFNLHEKFNAQTEYENLAVDLMRP